LRCTDKSQVTDQQFQSDFSMNQTNSRTGGIRSAQPGEESGKIEKGGSEGGAALYQFNEKAYRKAPKFKL